MKKIIFFGFCLLISQLSDAQRTDKRLQSRVAEMLKGYNGNIGIYDMSNITVLNEMAMNEKTPETAMAARDTARVDHRFLPTWAERKRA